jgi:hypothetical protein
MRDHAALVTVTSGADKVFRDVAARNGAIAVTSYTRDFSATHDPATCDVKAPTRTSSSPPGVQL